MDLGLYELVGEEGLARVTRAFYERVRSDPILGPMYPEQDWDGAEERLRDFLVGRFGGPQRYVERRGHPRLRMRHARFAIDADARDAWVAHMTAAIEAAELPVEAADPMRRFLSETATFLINR